MSMKVKAWNDGTQSETGEGYGITISKSNRKNYFCNDWDVITIHIDNNEVEIELEETFWTTDNIIKHIEIGKYLIGNGFATWGYGKPPVLELKILNQQEFLLEVQTTAKKMQYNLSGHGQLSFYLYPYAEKIYDILCNHNYDAKFNYTNQLGALKRVLPGAHYTRNEYIILQWYLIHELKNRMKDVGLGSSNQVLKDISIEGHSTITGGDLLQCLALLSNMGHFPDTFAASRVWLDLLNDNHMRLKTGYKRGLERDESKLLDVIIENNDLYNIHLLNGIYMLNRHKRVRDEDAKKFIELSIKILKEYIVGNDSDLKKYWGIYSMVRKLSYLILDSSYAPLPLNINLASVVSNFDLLFSRHMESEGTFNKAIKQLDEVMQDSIYLAGNSLIATAVRSKEIEAKFRQNETKEITIGNQKYTDVFDRVVVIERLLETRRKDSCFLSDIFNEYSSYKYPKVDWDDSNCLELKFSQAGSYSKLFRKDDYKWEKELHGKCKETYCYVGVFRNPKQEELRIIYSRNRTKKLINQHQALNTFTAEYVALRERYISSEFLYRNKYELENLKQVFEFHLKALFGWEYDITFEWPKLENSDLNPFFTGRGFKKVSDMIDKYIEASNGLVDDDSLHEIKCTRRVVFDSLYRGRFLVFVGATKVWGKDSKPIAEFDGVILYPNEKEDVIAEIVEAKNKPNGFTEAKNQLKKRLKQRKDIYDYQIERIDNKGAYASISFKVD